MKSSMTTSVMGTVSLASDIFTLFVRCLMSLLRLRWRWSEVMGHIVQMGNGSLPIVVICTTFAGLVVTMEIAWHMDQALHTISMIPGFTGQFIIRELGVIVPAFLLVAKVGASTTAEVGTMKVTEQIEALKLLGIEPVGYLVVPRMVACIFSAVCLTLIAVMVTLGGALTVAIVKYQFSWLEYLNMLEKFIGMKDLLSAITKSAAFGAVIPVISCTYGFRCKKGAEGVGTATTNSVVTATLVVIVIDFVVTYFFTSLL